MLGGVLGAFMLAGVLGVMAIVLTFDSSGLGAAYTRFGAAHDQRMKDIAAMPALLENLESGVLEVEDARVQIAEMVRQGPVEYYVALTQIFQTVAEEETTDTDVENLAQEGAAWFAALSIKAEEVAVAIETSGTSEEITGQLQRLSNSAPKDYFSPVMDGRLAREPACAVHAETLYEQQA